MREIAARHGDQTPYAIAKRTGVSISSAYRYVDGSAQPDLNSALRLAQAYDLDIRTLMDPVENEDDAPAGAAA
nr:helix-turn-helix transcriptional regulator [Streptomyces harenosi]